MTPPPQPQTTQDFKDELARTLYEEANVTGETFHSLIVFNDSLEKQAKSQLKGQLIRMLSTINSTLIKSLAYM